MNAYVLWTNTGRRFFVNATFSHQADDKVKPHLRPNETVAAWDMLTGRDINGYPYVDLRQPLPEPATSANP